MRLVSYHGPGSGGGGPLRAGAVRDGEVVDVADAAGALAGAAGAELSSVRGVLGLGERLDALWPAIEAGTAVGRVEELRLGPPLPDPDKILCIGLNYAEHAAETDLDPTAVPTVFAKFRNSLIGHRATVEIPPGVARIDYEGELAVVIGRRCRRVPRGEALGCVAGVMPFNDVSARELQMQASQWTTGKAVDTFAPCGPELVLLDEIRDLQDLRLRTRVNGTTVQDATTSMMIFDVATIVAFLSATMTLEIGDIIATGTPAGVGFTREPPLYLRPGDHVEVEIDGVGLLTNLIGDESQAKQTGADREAVMKDLPAKRKSV